VTVTEATPDRQSSGTALRRCAAVSADVFADEYWGRSPLLSRAAELGSDFGDLLSADAVDELVSRRGLRTPFLRMAKDGTVQPATAFTRGGGAGAAVGDQAADDKILRAIDDGSTLVLQGLHRTWPPLVDLGARLADEIGHPVQINAYITPPQNQGFAPHHDVHDVFVLQVTGHKHWTVHRPVLQDPLDSQPFDGYKSQIAQRVTEPALIDTTLAPGDALYLPRGTIHSAQAQGETSIHLTIGVHALTRYQLVRFLLDAVQDDPALRRSLPMGVDLTDPDVLAPELAATVSALQASLARVGDGPIAERVERDLMRRTRPQPLGPLAQLAAADALTADTPLRRRGALRLRVDGDASAAKLVLPDRTIELTDTAPETVAPALDGRVFTPAELPGRNTEAQLALARRLLAEGVVMPA
jgi:bifunctional lysine-specific demethylase and histidyl-hydroxylase NO66